MTPNRDFRDIVFELIRAKARFLIVGAHALSVHGVPRATADLDLMNGLKNWGGGVMNLVAVVIFSISGVVNWPVALAMAVGAALGGLGESLLAQRVGPAWVRRAIVTIGLGSGLAMLFGLV